MRGPVPSRARTEGFDAWPGGERWHRCSINAGSGELPRVSKSRRPRPLRHLTQCPVRLEAKGDRAAIVLSKAPPATNGATRPSGPSPEVVISARAADVVEWSAAVRSGARRDARRGASPAPSHRRAMGVDGAQRVASRSAHARGGPPRPRRRLTRIGDLKR